jgi:hypothetical protein
MERTSIQTGLGGYFHFLNASQIEAFNAVNDLLNFDFTDNPLVQYAHQFFDSDSDSESDAADAGAGVGAGAGDGGARVGQSGASLSAAAGAALDKKKTVPSHVKKISGTVADTDLKLDSIYAEAMQVCLHTAYSCVYALSCMYGHAYIHA